jgi:pyruvate kinase
MRRTKIVCTIGPVTDSEDALKRLIEAGMNVARLNFSHGSHVEHLQTLNRIRKVAEQLGEPIAVLQDLAGPKLRVGKFKKGSADLKSGQPFTLTINDVAGDESRVSVTFPELTNDVKPGDRILLADGSIELVAEKVDANNVVCKVKVGGVLSSHKGVNLPGISLSVEAFTEKDRADLEFGLEHSVDYVAMSFVRRKEDILHVLEIMESKNQRIPIIAKIEKHEALENINEIIEIADGIMVARGDLAVETALERVPLAQKMLIKLCNEASKPVITATQMLKSMVDSPRPTRAEANDVANAVLDGTDAVMLSEETTVGNYPTEAVQTMTNIIEVTESSEVAQLRRQRLDREVSTIAQAVSHASYQMARDLNAAVIITPTQSGGTPRMVSSFRPRQPIVALSPIPEVVRRLSLVWGVYPIVSGVYQNTDEMMEEALDKVRKSDLAKIGDKVVITAGVPVGVAGTTNLIKAETIW